MPYSFDTAGNLVNQAAKELRLITSTVADPYASTDGNIVALCSFLDSVGKEMRRKKQWNWLRQSYVFTTITGQGLYPVAPDYDSFVNQTGWNRTNRLPLGGPLSPQQYAFFKARLVGVVYTILFDFIQGQFRAFPDVATPGNYVIAYEYMSKWWAAPAIPAWVTATAYTKYQLTPSTGIVQNNGNLYFASSAGTSGAGPGPSQLDNSVYSDGGVNWSYAIPWAANTAYGGGGTQFSYVLSNGNIYKATTAGVSGASAGYAPFGNGVGIVDGTVQWQWLGPAAYGGATAGGPATPLPMLEGPTKSTDTVQFDSVLMREALKLKYRDEMGLPITDKMQSDYEALLSQAMNSDATAPVLRLDGGTYGQPLLSEFNLPETGWGN